MTVNWDDRDLCLRRASAQLSPRLSFRLTVEPAPGTTSWEWLVWRVSPHGDPSLGGWSDSAAAAKAAAQAALEKLITSATAIAA